MKKDPAPTIITTHANADFDALSAMVAASKIYTDAVLVFPGSQEKNLRNFYIQSAMYMFNFRNVKDIDLSTVKTLVVVDTRQKPRLKHVAPVFDNPGLEIHAFDHHPDTDDDVSYSTGIVNNWGSTATIISHEMMKKGMTLKPDEATIIGLGVYEDTGSFAFNSTTTHDFQAAAWLLSQGMDVTVISDLITRDLNAEQVSLLNTMLESAKTHTIHGESVVVTEVSTEEYVNDFALLTHKIMDIENLRVLFALGRMHDRIHLVARSRSSEVDVGQICSFFGGGGHASAASASIKDRTLSQVKDDLFALLYSHINPQHTVQELMSHPVVVVEQSMSTAEANEIMTRYGLKAAPIVNAQSGEFVGVLEHQTADKAQGHGLGETPCTEYMMRGSETVGPEEDLYAVMEIVLSQGQRLVPVKQDDTIIGVITRTDLINILIDEPSRIPEAMLPDRARERNIRIMMHERLPAEMYEILVQAGELAEEMDCAVYAVGGFVRDIIMGTPNLDLDLVVEGDGIAFAQALGKRYQGRVRPHRKFQTAVVVLPDGQHIDVVTARLEYYEHPAALPTVELSSIKMDLYRRDFTINALAVQLNPGSLGRLVDFFGAQGDIKSKVIRVLHSLSFVEDPTRILRAIRFAKRYDFRIGGQTERLIKNAMQLKMMQKLSGSRLFNEMRIIFNESNALDCLRTMRHYGILKAIHPLLQMGPTQEELIEEVVTVLDWYRLLYQTPSARPWLLFFMALANGAKEDKARDLARRFNLTPRQEEDFITLRKEINKTIFDFKNWHYHKGPDSELFFLLSKVPLDGVLFFMAKFKQEDIRKILSQYLTQLKGQTLDISGKDLQNMGLPSGPVFGQILDKVHAAMLDGQADCRADQLALAKKLVKDPRYKGLDAQPVKTTGNTNKAEKDKDA